MKELKQARQDVTQLKLNKSQPHAALSRGIESKRAQQAKQVAPDRAAREPGANLKDAEHGCAGLIKAHHTAGQQVCAELQ